MTDQEVLTQIQYALVEPPDGGVTVASGLWTPAELQDAITNAQQWVFQEAHPQLKRTTLVTVPNQQRYALPQDWFATQRVVWHDPTGYKIDLGRDASWSADQLTPYWPVQSEVRPQIYNDSETPMPQLMVMPAALDTGVLELTYVPVPPTLSNTGITWLLPDVLIPMAKWKAIAILLAKDGRGQDLPRAKQANDLAEQGMAALHIFLKGWLP
jgi:hypothetical protein